MVSKGCKPGVSPPFQRNTVNFNHCARFGSLSRAIDKTDPPSLSPCPSRLVLVAALLLPYQPLLHVPGRFRDTNASRSYVTCPLSPDLSPKPPPHFPFPRRTLLCLEVPPLLARAWLPKVVPPLVPLAIDLPLLLVLPPQARDGYVRRGSRSTSGQRSVVATVRVAHGLSSTKGGKAP